MSALPLKPEYQPTLGRLLAPRWRAASMPIRALASAGAIGLVALVVAGVLSLLPATLSHHGVVSWSLQYRALYRVAPDPGGYAKIVRHRNGRLADSLAVGPLRLPPYRGEVSGELPLYAVGYVRQLSTSHVQFDLQGEGATRVNTVLGYAVYYSANVEGQMMYGRDVLLVADRPGVRDGVIIEMLSTPGRLVNSPAQVGRAGVLLGPLQSFTFGA